MNGAARAVLVSLMGLGAACGDGSDGVPVGLGADTDVEVRVVVTLAPDLPTFKVDGRIGLTYTLGAPFAGGSDVGTVVLPAGTRTAEGALRLPPFGGRLIARERTVSPFAPFLCGEAGVASPGAGAVSIRLDLCHP